MGLSNVFYNMLPLRRKEDFINRKNVKLINEFLRERKKLQTSRQDDLERLKEMRKNRYIDGDTYLRLKEVMVLTHEENRIQLINSITNKRSNFLYYNTPATENSDPLKDEEINS